MSAAIQRVDAAGAGLERLAERQRAGREQVRQVAIMTAVGAIFGVVVWMGFSGPIARALPASWSVPSGWPPRRCGWTAGMQAYV